MATLWNVAFKSFRYIDNAAHTWYQAIMELSVWECFNLKVVTSILLCISLLWSLHTVADDILMFASFSKSQCGCFILTKFSLLYAAHCCCLLGFSNLFKQIPHACTTLVYSDTEGLFLGNITVFWTMRHQQSCSTCFLEKEARDTDSFFNLFPKKEAWDTQRHVTVV